MFFTVFFKNETRANISQNERKYAQIGANERKLKKCTFGKLVLQLKGLLGSRTYVNGPFVFLPNASGWLQYG